MPHCASDACRRPQRWWSRSTAGANVDGAWLCSRTCVEQVVRSRLETEVPSLNRPNRLRPVRLGAMLRHLKACAPEQIEQALAAQAESRLRLGEQLRSMGVDAVDILRALAAQAGVSYLSAVDVAAVHDAPGGLPLDVIRALGILPIGPPHDDRIRVAVAAPVPRAALTAFLQQTGWMPEPFLVGDEEWLRLLDHYGIGLRNRGASARMFVRATDIEDAVRSVSDALVAVDRATVNDARWGSHVWVRVRGGEGVIDVLSPGPVSELTRDTSRKEDPWPVASMSR